MLIVERGEADVGVAVRPRPGQRRRAPIVVREQHLGDQPIAALADRLDVGRVAAAVADQAPQVGNGARSEEHTSELQSLMRISYAVFCLKKKNKNKSQHNISNEPDIRNTR